jgi:hypothetical protein
MKPVLCLVQHVSWRCQSKQRVAQGSALHLVRCHSAMQHSLLHLLLTGLTIPSFTRRSAAC